MADRAIVVGCDSYPLLPNGDLRGAVRDAHAMCDWLVDPAGGGLAPADVVLLTAPTAASPPAPAGFTPQEARRATLAAAVERAVTGPGGRRLWLYLAGHGCRTSPANPRESRDVVVFPQFEAADPGGAAVAVDDLVDRLALSRFDEVFVVVDACRNLPFRTSFGVAPLGFDPAVVGPGGRPRVFVFQATAPGEVARGDGPADAVRGVFSVALLDGLRGTGAAKLFDDADETGRPYRVTWNRLCEAVAAAVTGQTPRFHGEGDPVLATFPDGWFPDVRLDVEIDPGDADPADLAGLVVDVRYPSPGAGDDGWLQRPGPAPIALTVPPRRHRVSAQAGGLRGKRAADAYADGAVTVRLAAPPDPPSPPASVLPERGGVDGPAPVVRGDGTTTLVVDVPDPFAVVEVRTAGGRRVEGATGVGGLAVAVDPGSYDVVVVGADAVRHRVPVDLDAGEFSRLEVAVPTTEPTEGPDRARAERVATLLAAGAPGLAALVEAARP